MALKDAEFTTVKILGSKATVAATTKPPAGQDAGDPFATDAVYELVRSGDGWLVNGLDG